MAPSKEPSRGARIFGYVVAVAVNAAMLVIAYRILDRGWLPFLTEEWRDVLPILTVSLVATIVVNLGYIAYDARWLRSLVGVALLTISLFVTVRMLQVYPFDFSRWDGPWDTLTRLLLILAIVGTAIGIVAEVVKLVRLASQAPEPSAVPPQPPAA
jgi:hypothetical protein